MLQACVKYYDNSSECGKLFITLRFAMYGLSLLDLIVDVNWLNLSTSAWSPVFQNTSDMALSRSERPTPDRIAPTPTFFFI